MKNWEVISEWGHRTNQISQSWRKGKWRNYRCGRLDRSLVFNLVAMTVLTESPRFLWTAMLLTCRGSGYLHFSSAALEGPGRNEHHWEHLCRRAIFRKVISYPFLHNVIRASSFMQGHIYSMYLVPKFKCTGWWDTDDNHTLNNLPSYTTSKCDFYQPENWSYCKKDGFENQRVPSLCLAFPFLF